jgi:hypothetical protein
VLVALLVTARCALAPFCAFDDMVVKVSACVRSGRSVVSGQLSIGEHLYCFSMYHCTEICDYYCCYFIRLVYCL